MCLTNLTTLNSFIAVCSAFNSPWKIEILDGQQMHPKKILRYVNKVCKPCGKGT